jgi:DNA recombination protein RmuC
MSLAIGIVIGIVLGLAVGVLAAAARFSRRHGAQQAALESAQLAAERQAAEVAQLRDAQQAATAEAAAQRALVASLEQARHEDREQFEERIASATHEVVAKGSERLAALATERFKTEVDPIKELLERYERSVHDLERKRELAYREVDDHLKRLTESEERLRLETSQLVTALRMPQTRGAWGEIQLRRLVEYAGMLEHCDFSEQVTSSTDEGRQRPDMVVRMPDGAQLIVDSKVPLDAYLRMVEAVDEDAKRAHAKEHARQLRNHIDALSKKDYASLLGTSSTGFVVCFVPGEPLVAAAFEAEPELIEYAFSRNVLVSGPVNLIALLKTVHLGWRHEALASSAAEVHEAGRTLHDRLSTFAGHLGKVGSSLNTAVRHYNTAVGSLESRLLPASRTFAEHQLVSEPVEAPDAVEEVARGLTRLGLSEADEPAGLHLLEAPEERPEVGGG